MRCGNDRSIFNCREIWKSYDQPENILLKYLILNIDKQLKFLEKQLNSSDNLVDKSWMKAIIDTREIINFAERNVYFQKIRTKNITIDSRLIYQIKHSRDKFCKEILLEAYELYKDILLPSLFTLSKNSEKLMQIIEETEINPRNDDELFELYALWKLIDNFSDYEEITPIGINSPHSCYITKLKITNKQQQPIEITLFYQRLGSWRHRPYPA